MNLFPEPIQTSGGLGGKMEDNIIEIDLQNPQDSRAESVKKDFGNLHVGES